MKEEKKEEKEKDPWWTPKLSRGNNLHVFLCKVYGENNCKAVSVFWICQGQDLLFVFIHTGFGDHINWVSYEKGFKEAKDRFVTTELTRQ